MESAISNLLREYENGKITRRQLIQSLAVTFIASASASAAGPSTQSSTGFETIGLDHISYQVSDYRRTRDFYADLMGMEVSGDNGRTQCQLRFGDAILIARNRRPREGEPAPSGPLVDHIAYKIENWDTDSVRAELERRGLTPRLDTGGGEGYASFHVADPDGFDLQISGDIQPGDSLYERGSRL